MTLLHENRIRRRSGSLIVRELMDPELRAYPKFPPTENEIRQRAHQIYLRRGGRPGNAVLDWLQAELELGGGKVSSNSGLSQFPAGGSHGC